MSKRIAIFVIAYNAVKTLAETIDRIPPEVLEKVEEIFVIDDCSNDNTYYAAIGYKEARKLDKLTVFLNPVNLRYGGNQKRGYQYAIDRGYDIVVMLHGDGQYAPEALPMLLEPLENDEADMVFGSRMAAGQDPLKGGMPLYKFVGNKILTTCQNKLLGMKLSEFHSGYRLYNCKVLAELPFQRNSNEWHFDTEIIIQHKEAGYRIAERPIPTYYGDEICHVNGLGYAFEVMRTSFAYVAHKNNWFHFPQFEVKPNPRYDFKPDPFSSHTEILAIAERERPKRVLEVGTASGYLSERLKNMGAEVIGIELDADMAAQAAPHCETMLVGDVDGQDLESLGAFDMIICADVLEHLPRPEATLARLNALLKPGGHIVVSLPNIAMWLWRVKLLFGKFDYMPKGPMDETHLRFYTLTSAQKLLKQSALQVLETRTTPIPLPTISPIFSADRKLGFVHKLNHWLTQRRPTLFGYQFVFFAQKSLKPAVTPGPNGELQLRMPVMAPIEEQVKP
jgi:glycosyltransferase involved in cell wall biosynthesis